MGKIVLISCCRKKLENSVRAEDLYIGPLFKKSLEYAKSLEPDNIFILSAKYGLVGLEEEIDFYDLTLNEMNCDTRREWASEVLFKLRASTNLINDEFIFLAGKNYREYLLPSIENKKIPMEGLRIGEQLHWLNKRNNGE